MVGHGGSASERPIAVVPDEVAKMGGYAHDQAGTLRNALDSMDREIADLMAAGWSGPAAEGFARGWAECRDGGNQIFDTLTELASKLGGGSHEYRDGDHGSADRIAEVNS
ncbi:WXG100 family type VII secretion target [Nocardia sp. CA2R105]|uniref:WXG100 family type VII secretion target n=1 Tax=Nocardia coffeae TaxID=2873381 RepID=UPI001CA7A491|nr:WXG100 family type VII secretion target [Nocardia coffeae]MBY8857013.1 WXG100 family type VII secretion target [Nocardia coffeae]